MIGAGSARLPREMTIPTGSLSRSFSVVVLFFIYIVVAITPSIDSEGDESSRGMRRERFAALRPAAQSRLPGASLSSVDASDYRFYKS